MHDPFLKRLREQADNPEQYVQILEGVIEEVDEILLQVDETTPDAELPLGNRDSAIEAVVFLFEMGFGYSPGPVSDNPADNPDLPPGVREGLNWEGQC